MKLIPIVIPQVVTEHLLYVRQLVEGPKHSNKSK